MGQRLHGGNAIQGIDEVVSEHRDIEDRPPRSARRFRIAIAALLAASALFVMFWRLSVPQWNLDEVIYRDAGRHEAVESDYRWNREHPLLAKEFIGVSAQHVGQTTLGVRIPGAIMGIGVGLALLALGTAIAGLEAGLAAAALWWLLPQAPDLIRIDRVGLLEAPMVFFASLAILAGYRWAKTGAWLPAVLGGVAVGFSMSSKLTGAIFLPIVLVGVFWVPRPAKTRLFQSLALVSAACAGFILPYLPDPRAFSDIAYAFSFQAHHASGGHALQVAGVVYEHAPWWSYFWYEKSYLGIAGVLAFWAAAIAFIVRGGSKRDRAIVGAAVAVVATTLAVSPLKLWHYHLVLLMPLSLAAGLGIVKLARSGRTARVVAGLVAIILLVSAVGQIHRVATIQRGDYESVGAYLATTGLDQGVVLVFGYRLVLRQYLLHSRLIETAPRKDPTVMVVDPVVAQRHETGTLGRYVANLAKTYELRRIGRLQVYVKPSDCAEVAC